MAVKWADWDYRTETQQKRPLIIFMSTYEKGSKAARMNVVVIGICGASASGKSTLARHLHELLKSPVNVLGLDAFFDDATCDDLNTWEHPDCLQPDAFVQELQRRKQQALVAATNIGHSAEELVTTFVIAEGFLLFAFEKIVRECNIRILMDASGAPELLCTRRFRRGSRRSAQHPLSEIVARWTKIPSSRDVLLSAVDIPAHIRDEKRIAVSTPPIPHLADRGEGSRAVVGLMDFMTSHNTMRSIDEHTVMRELGLPLSANDGEHADSPLRALCLSSNIPHSDVEKLLVYFSFRHWFMEEVWYHYEWWWPRQVQLATLVEGCLLHLTIANMGTLDQLKVRLQDEYLDAILRAAGRPVV